MKCATSSSSTKSSLKNLVEASSIEIAKGSYEIVQKVYPNALMKWKEPENFAILEMINNIQI